MTCEPQAAFIRVRDAVCPDEDGRLIRPLVCFCQDGAIGLQPVGRQLGVDQHFTTFFEVVNTIRLDVSLALAEQVDVLVLVSEPIVREDLFIFVYLSPLFGTHEEISFTGAWGVGCEHVSSDGHGHFLPGSLMEPGADASGLGCVWLSWGAGLSPPNGQRSAAAGSQSNAGPEVVGARE